MAVLPKYNTLEDKSTAFEQVVLRNKDDIRHKFRDKMREEVNPAQHLRFIYRGVTNSSYKIFNSAQRHFIEKELENITTYEAFITGTINEALNYHNGLLRRYFDGLGMTFDIPVLSFLQHYGAPTPLIDWTYNFKNALFFTTDGHRHVPSNNEIDNYFSIYSIDKNATGLDLINISFWLSDHWTRLKEIIHEHPEVDATNIETMFRTFSYNTFSTLELFYISDFEKVSDIPSITSHSNLNIINQEGLFLFNSSQTDPLESYFGGHREPFTGLPKIKCYDIHKSLYYYVLNEITEARRDLGLIALTKEFIYPQEENIARKAFENYLSR